MREGPCRMHLHYPAHRVLPGIKVPQAIENTIDLVRRVVVKQSDAQKAAAAFDIEPLGEVQGVVVAVPGENSTLPQAGGEFQRRVSVHPEGDGRGALRETAGI